MSTELDHLLDRATRNVILPAEGDRLRELVAQLAADVDTCRTRYATQADNALHLLEVAGTRVIELTTEVVRLTAGQCTCSLAMCEQHHTQPVATCPYPRCLAAQMRQENADA